MLNHSKEPRGFGFVTFAEYSSVEGVLEVLAHRINDKLVSDFSRIIKLIRLNANRLFQKHL